MNVIPFRKPTPPAPPPPPTPYVHVYLDDALLMKVEGDTLSMVADERAIRTVRRELIAALDTLDEQFPHIADSDYVDHIARPGNDY